MLLRFLFLGVVILVIISLLKPVSGKPTPLEISEPQHSTVVGTSFSEKQTHFLGLNSRETLSALLELGIREYRLAAYWDEIEKTPGVYTFSSLDWQIELLERYGARATIVMGIKNFRWPEFHYPAHVIITVEEDGTVLLGSNDEQKLFSYLEQVVVRYRGKPTVVTWQVENEPLNRTGPERRQIDEQLLKKEIDFVASLDGSRPILVTAFGGMGILSSQEWTKWKKILNMDNVDILGLDLYFSRRMRDGEYVGIDINTHELKRWIREAEHRGKKLIIAEQQAEPWEHELALPFITKDVPSMNPERLSLAFRFVTQAPYPVIYLWGSEWWYRELKRGNPTWWEAVKTVLEHNNEQK